MDVYNPISSQYKELFGSRAQKIPVTIATDCPNRRGLNGMQTCIFCDEWGSAAYSEQKALNLSEQIASKIEMLGERYNSVVFLAYFQAYTNTFMGTQKLRESFECALSFEKIKGLIIGTRPDCISPSVINLWNDFSKRTFVSVELGVQSFFDDKLKFLKRGHSAQKSIEAIKKIKNETSVDLGIHLIFGLPNETDDQIIETANIISRLPIDNVKLHNLHVLKNTPLAEMYFKKEFCPVELDEYARRVALFLQYLPSHIRIHRLAALSSRWDELIAPDWTKYKMKSTQFILDLMTKEKMYQGQLKPLPRVQ